MGQRRVTSLRPGDRTPGSDGWLYLADAATRRVLWITNLRGQIRFTMDDGIIYASSEDGYLYKLDTETREIFGRAYVEAWLYRNSLSISGDERYAFTIGKIGRACLTDLENIEVLWWFDMRGGWHATA